MDPLSGTLRDIHGLDGVPWWPPAPGWWLLLVMIVLLVLVVRFRYWILQRISWAGWRNDARRQLRNLRKALSKDDPRVVADRLSELLRRIAMARSGRRVAAGLTGDAWLRWLAAQDTSGFDWEKHAQVLLVAPYMPPAKTIERADLTRLIRAATRWIDATHPSRQHKAPRRNALSVLRSLVRVGGESARV